MWTLFFLSIEIVSLPSVNSISVVLSINDLILPATAIMIGEKAADLIIKDHKN